MNLWISRWANWHGSFAGLKSLEKFKGGYGNSGMRGIRLPIWSHSALLKRVGWSS